jgi:hypothetical protein
MLPAFLSVAFRIDLRVRAQLQGILGIEVILPAPGSFEVKPVVALLAAHDARMSVACCDTYPFSRSVALDNGSFVLPANDEAAVDITAGSLNADGPAEAGLGI